MNLQNLTPDQAELRALADINNLLSQSGMTCTELGLPEITNEACAASVQQPVPLSDEVHSSMTVLYNEQRQLVDTIIQALEAHDDEHLFNKARTF